MPCEDSDIRRYVCVDTVVWGYCVSRCAHMVSLCSETYCICWSFSNCAIYVVERRWHAWLVRCDQPAVPSKKNWLRMFGCQPISNNCCMHARVHTRVHKYHAWIGCITCNHHSMWQGVCAVGHLTSVVSSLPAHLFLQITGRHRVRDVACKYCGERLGWFYVSKLVTRWWVRFYAFACQAMIRQMFLVLIGQVLTCCTSRFWLPLSHNCVKVGQLWAQCFAMLSGISCVDRVRICRWL